MIKINYEGTDYERLNKEILKIYESLIDFFETKPFPVKVNIYDNKSDFNKRIGRTESPDWLVANASSKNNEINILSPLLMEKESNHNRNEFLQIIKHELTHLFVNDLAKGNIIPVWLNEGIASYVAQQNQLKKKQIDIEKDFCKNLSTSEDWNKRVNNSAYEIASLFTLFLIKKYSFKKIKELISSLEKEFFYENFKKIFFEVYKKDISEIENMFILEMNNK